MTKVPSTYAGNCAARKPSTALLMLSLAAMLLLCRVALFLLEVILLAILNRIDANPQSGTVGPMYKVAINELYLVQISGFWVHMELLHTTLLFQLYRCSLLWSHCCWTELTHKAATVTFNNAHIARAINTRCQLMKKKKKKEKRKKGREGRYLPLPSLLT